MSPGRLVVRSGPTARTRTRIRMWVWGEDAGDGQRSAHRATRSRVRLALVSAASIWACTGFAACGGSSAGSAAGHQAAAITSTSASTSSDSTPSPARSVAVEARHHGRAEGHQAPSGPSQSQPAMPRYPRPASYRPPAYRSYRARDAQTVGHGLPSKKAAALGAPGVAGRGAQE